MYRTTFIKVIALLLLAFLAVAAPAAAQGTGVIEGTVTMPGGESLPEGLEVELLFLPNGQGPPVIKKMPLAEDGSYRFTEVDPSPQHRYLVRVKLEGEDNLSDVLAFGQGESTLQVELRLLERTTDASALSLPAVNMVMDVRPEGWIVVVLYRYQNSGEQIILSETNPPIELPLPAEALGVQFGEEMRPEGIIELSDGFAYTGPFAPGETPVVVSYLLPYQEGEQEVTLRLGAEAGEVRLFVPQLGQRTETTDMTALGIEDGIEGRSFEVYESSNASAEQDFTFRFSGLPPAPAPEPSAPTDSAGPRVVPISPLEELPWWSRLIPVVMGLLAIALYLAVRPAPSGAEQRGALRQRRDTLVTEIAMLDIRYEGGMLGEQTHSRQRAALKRELKEILHRLGGESARSD